MRYLIAFSLLLAACSDPNAQKSAVVRQIESAGSGDISSMTSIEIEDWLGRNADVRLIESVASTCKGLRRHAKVGWETRTAEGRACDAAMDIRVFLPKDFSGDGRSF